MIWSGNGVARRLLWILTLAMPLCGTAQAQQEDTAFLRWAAGHIHLIRSVEPDGRFDDLAPLRAIIGTSRVVALGEPAHGAHEPLALRNRIFQYLVEELGFTAIALESGLPESRRIHDFVLGAPGNVGKTVAENLTWGFGGFEENADLIRWIRAYNADPSHRRKVRFYGMDLSLGGPTGSTPTPAPLAATLSYLDHVAPADARLMRTALRPWMERLPGGPEFTPAEHDSLTSRVDALIALLEQKRGTYVRAGGEAEYAWAHRNALVARQADNLFRVLSPRTTETGILPDEWRNVNIRDSAMAENALWALEQAGHGGRMLIFAHNAHVMNSPITGGIWTVFERPPNSMAQSLRAALGNDLVLLATGAATNGSGLPAAPPDSGSLDDVLARVDSADFVLDIRPARTDLAAVAWLAKPRALRANFTTSLLVSPTVAFDGILFLRQLTPARPRIDRDQ